MIYCPLFPAHLLPPPSPTHRFPKLPSANCGSSLPVSLCAQAQMDAALCLKHASHCLQMRTNGACMGLAPMEMNYAGFFPLMRIVVDPSHRISSHERSPYNYGWWLFWIIVPFVIREDSITIMGASTNCFRRMNQSDSQ